MLWRRADLGSAVSSCMYTTAMFSIACQFICRSFSGWDMHDQIYSRELLISNKSNGYRDLIASIDLSTYRRIPWENNVPFFLVTFLDPDTRKPICACPRGTLAKVVDAAQAQDYQCLAGAEYEVSTYIVLPSCCSYEYQYFHFKGA